MKSSVSDINIARLETVAAALGALVSEVVFVGGATLSFYLDDTYCDDIRPTADVDIVVSVTTRKAYAHLEAKLRDLGFVHCTERDAPICRFVIGKIKVDILPSHAQILGFTNAWYADAMADTQEVRLPSGTSIRIFSAPYFLATKIEAFEARGANAFRFSEDIEDIITVLDGRSALEAEIRAAPEKLRAYLRYKFAAFLTAEDFHDAIYGALRSSLYGMSRVEKTLALLRRIGGSE